MRRSADIRSSKGQTMVEVAIVLPTLCLLLFGVIQFGILFNNYITLTDAVRAGARKAVVSRVAADPVGTTTQAVRNSAYELDTSKLTITVTSTWQHGQDVTVVGSYPYDINLLGMVVASGQLRATTTERVE